ncbi:hypothetical protein E4U54_001979 [Claviceps lovelessii]|nr:hypothetical protein E4U54_001979 [Claviceps lovelessii]
MTSELSPANAAVPHRDAHSDHSLIGLTPERFEKELTDLAAKAKGDTFGHRLVEQSGLYARIFVLLSILGIYSHVSQLNLSPVYGSIPASIWHAKLLMAGCFLGWAGNTLLRDTLPIPTAKALPIVAICVPGVQHLLGTYSQSLGPQLGPVVTELFTLLPLAILTAASVADCWQGVLLSKLPRFVADAGPGIASWALFKSIENKTGSVLPLVVGRFVVFTRVGFEILLSVGYMVLSPSKYLVYTAFPFFHTFLLNTHVQSPAATQNLMSGLMTDGWLLLERRESVTGYLSVVQSMQQGFRAMRCDHSLLGGEWINHGGGLVSEPIYGVFAMLEAVRLAERVPPVADQDAKALVM